MRGCPLVGLVTYLAALHSLPRLATYKAGIRFLRYPVKFYAYPPPRLVD